MSARLQMPGAMPAEIAERLSDVPSRVTAKDLDYAREDIIERLLDGKNFRTINSRDIFDCALNDEFGYRRMLDLLDNLLGLSNKGGDDFLLAAHALAKQAREEVERFVDGKDDWIADHAAELAADEGEEYEQEDK